MMSEDERYTQLRARISRLEAEFERAGTAFRDSVAAIAKPGDTVLIGLRETLSDEELEAMVEDFKGFTETTGIHIGLVEGASSMAVLRPGDEEINDWSDA